MNNSRFYPPKQHPNIQLPGVDPRLLPGYPTRGFLRVMALASIHGWRHLEKFAAAQLAKNGGRYG